MLTPTLLALSLCQSSLPDAAELLDRREAKLGPLEKRSAARGLVVTGTLDMKGCPPGTTFEELHRVGPGEERVRFTLTMEGWGSTSQGTDGKVSWTTDPAFGVSVQEGVEQMAVRRVWALQRSTPWRALYRAARTIGPAERDGRALLELELTPAEGKSERWFVDPETLELARVAVVYPNPTGGALPMEWTFGDWRAVDGILYPHQRGQVVQGGVAAGGEADALPMRITYTCTSIRHEPIELARIAPAPEVAAAIADPKLRAPAPPKDPDACLLETVERQHVATVRLTCDVDKVSATLAAVFTEVGTVLQAQGAAMSGPPFSRYHVIDVEQGKIDLEAGMPVAAPITPSGRVKASELPAGRTAVTWHTGSYHELQKSYDRLGAWMKREGLAARGGFWEIYWTDPGLEPDPSTWRTQILWPVE